MDQPVEWVDPRSVLISSHMYCGDERDYLSAQINLECSRQFKENLGSICYGLCHGRFYCCL